MNLLIGLALWVSTPVASAASIDDAHARVIALSPSERADAVASLAVLSAEDPYVRASLQIPLALDAVVRRRSREVPRAAREDWAALERLLASHVAVLEVLQVDDVLEPSTDLVGTTLQTVDSLSERAARVDPERAVDLDAHNDRLEWTTGVIRPCPRGPWAVLPGHSWTLGMELREVEQQLAALEPLVRGSAVEADVAAMNALMASWQRHSVD